MGAGVLAMPEGQNRGAPVQMRHLWYAGGPKPRGAGAKPRGVGATGTRPGGSSAHVRRTKTINLVAQPQLGAGQALWYIYMRLRGRGTAMGLLRQIAKCISAWQLLVCQKRRPPCANWVFASRPGAGQIRCGGHGRWRSHYVASRSGPGDDRGYRYLGDTAQMC
jgi:hypothetical protein